MEFFNYFVFIVSAIYFINIKTVASEVPDMTPFLKEMSTNLYVTFDNETEVYKPKSVEDIMNSTRKQFLSSLLYTGHYGYNSEIITACYFTIVTYRAAMWDLRRYFEIRQLYLNTLEFEVGYLAHEIVYRYQLALELYNFVERKFTPHQNKNFAPSNYMFYIYSNILEQCKVIFHLSNMMHELEGKYKWNKKGVFEDYIDPRRPRPDVGRNVTTEAGSNDLAAYERYLKQKRREQKKEARQRKKFYKEFAKFGSTTTRRKRLKKRQWPLIYGWSIENW